jgi:hypothetical protein
LLANGRESAELNALVRGLPIRSSRGPMIK